MSKVKIQGNASGTGVVTLTAPNTNTDRTITLPDETVSLTGAPAGLDDVGGVARATSGLLFNADTAAANALDDYEEGTWTPTNSGDTTGSVSSAYGHYVKIGRVVTLHGRLTISANFSSAYFGGLPFTINHLGGSGSGNHSLGLVKDDAGDHAVLTQNGEVRVSAHKISNSTGYYPISGKTWRFTITYTTLS